MKIKIIDLLNKIANGEELPKKIKFLNSIWEYCKDGSTQDYINDYYTCLMGFVAINKVDLNDEAEIIEEPKKIEKIDFGTLNTQKEKNRAMKDTINELIDEINKLKKKTKGGDDL